METMAVLGEVVRDAMKLNNDWHPIICKITWVPYTLYAMRKAMWELGVVRGSPKRVNIILSWELTAQYRPERSVGPLVGSKKKIETSNIPPPPCPNQNRFSGWQHFAHPPAHPKGAMDRSQLFSPLFCHRLPLTLKHTYPLRLTTTV